MLKPFLFTITLLLTVTANAALVERLGGLAYYDTEADLTWLADANAAGTAMNWVDANTWAADLTVGSVDGWRLPDTLQPDETCSAQGPGYWQGYNCTGSEMGNLFKNVLEGINGATIATYHNSNYDLFTNILTSQYWSATEFEAYNLQALAYNIDTGFQFRHDKNNEHFAWAVHSGDVSAVPVPGAVWLFGSGLIGLVGFARKKK